MNSAISDTSADTIGKDDDATSAGIITAVVFALIAFGGAVLGGHAGMRYHRRVDRELVVADELR